LLVLAVMGVVAYAQTADAGGPYTIGEGDAVTLDASECTSTVPIILYAWDLDGTAGAETTGVHPLVTWAELVAAGINDDGSYLITLSIEDEDGGTDSDTATIYVTNTAPVPNAGHTYDIDEGQSLVLDGTASFDYGDDVLGPYDWDIDGDKDYSDGISGSTVTVSWAQLESLFVNDDGEYTIWLRVADEDGAQSEASARLTIHDAPPYDTSAGGPYTIWEGDDLMLSGSTLDPSSADTFSYIWDFDGKPIGEPDFDDGTQGFTKTVPWEVLVEFGMGDGPINGTARLTVMDDDGMSDGASVSLVILNTAPSITECPDPLTTYHFDPVENLSGSFEDPGVDIWTGTVDWKDGTVDNLDIDQGNQEYALPSHTFSTAPPGLTDYDVEVTVSDDDGDMDTCTFTISVIHDVTPPTVVLTKVPAVFSNQSGPRLEWEGTDDFTPVNEIEYSYRLDGGAWSSWSVATWTKLSDLSEDDHVFEVRARDYAGNISDVVSTSWRTDTSAPVIEVDIPEAYSAYILHSVVLVEWTATDVITQVVTATGTAPSGGRLPTSRLGFRTFTVRATDKAGNTSEEEIPYWVIPGLEPDIPADSVGMAVRHAPRLGAPGASLELWSFLARPLEGTYDEEGNFVLLPLRYVKDAPIAVRFRLSDANGEPLIYESGCVWIDVCRVVPDGDLETLELVALYEVPLDPDSGQYETVIPYGESDDWWALTPGLYKLSLTVKSAWVESLEIESVWLEVPSP